jgi:hypothetical protein
MSKMNGLVKAEGYTDGGIVTESMRIDIVKIKRHTDKDMFTTTNRKAL